MSAKDTLRSNKTRIQRALCSDYGFILDKVLEKDLITDREYDNLKRIAGENDEKHVVELVDKIRGKGEEKCQGFVDLLQTDDIKKTYPELPELSNMKLHDAPPSSRPVQVSSVHSEVHLKQDVKRQRMDDFYPMNSQLVGLCLIINNDGSDKDAESLAKVFSWLGFRVLMCKNQTKDKMERTLTWFASLTNPAQLHGIDVEEWSVSKFTKSQPVLNHGDAFICCVLSHGNKGEVEDDDQEPFYINDITKCFKKTEQSALTGKPKVFLIQACQRVLQTDREENRSGSVYIPVEADFLVATATVEERWFVQSVCKQLWEHCPRGEDLIIILRHVNNEVSQEEGSKQPGKVKQMPEVRFTLTKRLKLSPHHN